MLQHLLLLWKWISKSSGKTVSPPAGLVLRRAHNQGPCGAGREEAAAEAALGPHRRPHGSRVRARTPGLFLTQLPCRAHVSRPQLTQHTRCWLRNLPSVVPVRWGLRRGDGSMFSAVTFPRCSHSRDMRDKRQPWWLVRPARTARISLRCFLEVAHSHCSLSPLHLHVQAKTKP